MAHLVTRPKLANMQPAAPSNDDVKDAVHFLGGLLSDITSKLREVEKQNENVALRPYVDERFARWNDVANAINTRIDGLQKSANNAEVTLERATEAFKAIKDRFETFEKGFRLLGEKVSGLETRINNSDVNTRKWVSQQGETASKVLLLIGTSESQQRDIVALDSEWNEIKSNHIALSQATDRRFAALESLVTSLDHQRREARRPLWKRIAAAFTRR